MADLPAVVHLKYVEGEAVQIPEDIIEGCLVDERIKAVPRTPDMGRFGHPAMTDPFTKQFGIAGEDLGFAACAEEPVTAPGFVESM
jgi:hypothetical protein